MNDIEFIASNNGIRTIKVNSSDTLEIVLDKLQRCKDFGIKAKAIFNGIEINNYENFDPQVIQNKIKDIAFKEREVILPNEEEKERVVLSNEAKNGNESSKEKEREVLFSEAKKGSEPSNEPEIILSNNNSQNGNESPNDQETIILSNEAKKNNESPREPEVILPNDNDNSQKEVQYLEVNEEDNIDIVAKKLEVCKEKGIDAIAIVDNIEVSNIINNNADDIKKEYQEKYNLEKDLKSQGITFMPFKYRYLSLEREHARMLRVKKFDRIWDIIHKLQICSEKGIKIWVNFNGVELNNYEFDFRKKLNDPYYFKNYYDKKFREQKERINNGEELLEVPSNNLEETSNEIDNSNLTSYFQNGQNREINYGGNTYKVTSPVNDIVFAGLNLNNNSNLEVNTPNIGINNSSLSNRESKIENKGYINDNLELNKQTDIESNIDVENNLDIHDKRRFINNKDAQVNEKVKGKVKGQVKGQEQKTNNEVARSKIAVLRSKNNKLLYNPEATRLNRSMAIPENTEYDEEEQPNVDSLNTEEETNENINHDGDNTAAENNESSQNVPSQTPSTNTKGKTQRSKNNKKLLAFILKHKWAILIGLGIGILVLIIIFAFYNNDEEKNFNSDIMGLLGYGYYELDNVCETVKVYNPKDGTYTEELDFETQYIPGVVQAEVGLFSDAPELLKLFAIAARTYALSRLSEDCTIEGSSTVQAFTFDKNTLAAVTSEDNAIRQAADATKGLVVVKDDKLLVTYYDAACYQGEDANYYKIGYGKNTLGELKIQNIPKSWANTKGGLMRYINNSKSLNRLCYQGHGRGISQYGAYYLAKEEGYTLNDLIEYYLGEVNIYSIYPGIASNYLDVTSSGANDQLTTTLKNALAKYNITPEAYNEFLLKSIVEAGVGTRNAVVTAAVTLVGGLYQNYGIRLPYTYSGQHGGSYNLQAGGKVNNPASGTFYGVDGNWGASIRYGNATYGLYTKYGPDCSGFVAWAIYNGGFKNVSSYQMYKFGQNIAFDGTKRGEPGDLVYHPGHIMLIVGVDEEAKVYYIAEASGRDDGVRIRKMSFSEKGQYVVKMDNWYKQHALNISNEEFISQFRSGYLEPYTGKYDMTLSSPVGVTGGSIYFVGDSRTVGVCNAGGICSDSSNCDTTGCLASTGKGYSWFKSNINKIAQANAHNIVINMGVNDLPGLSDGSSIAQKYFNDIKTMAQNNQNKIFYINSINPVGAKASVKANAVTTFNSKMQALISSSHLTNIRYLNTYNLNYSIASDGIHYNMASYNNLYNTIVKGVAK